MSNESSNDANKTNKCNPCHNGVSANENLVLFATNLAFAISRGLSLKGLATLTNILFITYETLSSILVQRRLDCPTPKEEFPTVPPQSSRERTERTVARPKKGTEKHQTL